MIALLYLLLVIFFLDEKSHMSKSKFIKGGKQGWHHSHQYHHRHHLY